VAHVGENTAELHASLADDVRAAGLDLVYTFGPAMAHLHAALPDQHRGGHFENRRNLFAAVRADLRPGDAITIKASFPSRFGALVRMFRAAASGKVTRQ
jgi:UDP-N-acetylmuramoyl-tripeptide--D-alanyl-D-alanine ligase